MSIFGPIGAIGAVEELNATGHLVSPLAVSGVQPSSSSADFASNLAGAIDGLQDSQARTQNLAMQAVTGNLENIHDYTIAAAESSLHLELVAEIRNKSINAFNEIMRMPA